jgi:hypothetical protein
MWSGPEWIKLMLLLFHPIWVTALAALVVIGVIRLLSRTTSWVRYRYWILPALVLLYAIDAIIALPRVFFSYQLAKQPVVASKIALPKQLVLIGVPCLVQCHEMLVSGALEDVIVVGPSYSNGPVPQPKRLRPDWVIPGTCPHERRRSIDTTAHVLSGAGYCPRVEPVEIPAEGIFLVREVMLARSREPARPFTPTYLTKGPPGSTIEFRGIEVQDRRPSRVTVLASTYKYTAPGFLGLPPLIGCWERPDNIMWIMPPGDTGCGLWRSFTGGGDDTTTSFEPKWLFTDVFAPPDRPVVAPRKPDLQVTPAQALEILGRVYSLELNLPRLRDALLDASNSDEALVALVVKRAQRGFFGGVLEGALIALLAEQRPATIAELSRRLDPLTGNFAHSGDVLDQMEKNGKFRDDFADTMFLALATKWQAPDNIDRLLALMESSHPGWVCDRLQHFGAARFSSGQVSTTVRQKFAECSRAKTN